MSLAIATNRPFREWVEEDPRVIATAFAVLEHNDREFKKNSKQSSRTGDRDPGAGGPQYSG